MPIRYPVKKMRIPARLRSLGNGRLPEEILTSTLAGGRLYVVASNSLNLMWSAARNEGITLKSVGAYRSLDQQTDLFLDRYSTKPTGRKPQVTRNYQGRTWYLKKGKAPSAVPATSNHGWGLAVDLDVTDPKTFKWLCKNAPTYGWYLQGRPRLLNGKRNPEYEPWHWQKVNA